MRKGKSRRRKEEKEERCKRKMSESRRQEIQDWKKRREE